MKVRILLLIIFVLAFAAAGFSQSVVLTAKKVVYKRPKPIMEGKESFTINYPKIKAATPALSKKIEAALSYSSVLGINIKEEQNEIQWLEDADYDVGYNADGILSMSLFMEGSGAYPSSLTKHVVVDIRTGTRVKPAAAFRNLPGLLAMVKKAKQKEVAEAIVELNTDPESRDENPERLFKDSDVYHKVSLNEFSIDEGGVVFYHEYGFRHAIKAMQPTGNFFFTWAELKPYIKPGGLLARVTR